jgi:formate-dependent phosphoribosylglycinamide formyltransferase (GAR transformylase)
MCCKTSKLSRETTRQESSQKLFVFIEKYRFRGESDPWPEAVRVTGYPEIIILLR